MIWSTMRVVDGTINGTQIAAPSTTRIALVIGAVNGSTIAVSTLADVTAVSGFEANTQEPVLTITYDVWGELVRQAWFVVVTGNANVMVAETFEVSDSALETMNRLRSSSPVLMGAQSKARLPSRLLRDSRAAMAQLARLRGKR